MYFNGEFVVTMCVLLFTFGVLLGYLLGTGVPKETFPRVKAKVVRKPQDCCGGGCNEIEAK